MQTFELIVGPDGCVESPDTQPGEIVTIQVARGRQADADHTDPIPLDEQEAIKERILRRAEKTRKKLPEPWRSADHSDLLYGEDGFPR